MWPLRCSPLKFDHSLKSNWLEFHRKPAAWRQRTSKDQTEKYSKCAFTAGHDKYGTMHGSQKWEDSIVGEPSALSFTAIKSAPLAAVTVLSLEVRKTSLDKQNNTYRYVIILD